MENQSGFPKRRTDSPDLSAKLKVMSELTETSKKTRWPRRYGAKYYDRQDNYKPRMIQRTDINTKCHHYYR